MTARIDVVAPATITVLAGDGAVTSLLPGSVSLNDPHAGGTISVKLTTANAGAALSAASAGGAAVSANANTLSITGSLAQVNAALASLQVNEAAGAVSDTVFLTATDPGALVGHTAFDVNVAPAGGPAFVAPPATISLRPNSLTTLGRLVIGDPAVAGLVAAGLGGEEMLALTLSAASGVLLLPGLSALDGIGVTGLGTGTLLLNFSADRLGAVNALLAGLEFAGPAAVSGLAYGLRDVSGPLGPAFTNGNIALKIAGAVGPNGTFGTGGQKVILGPETLAAGARLAVSGTLADLGGIAGAGALFVAPDAALQMDYNGLSLSGTSLDFGIIAATTFAEAGSIFLADGAVMGGPILAGAAALIDFAGTLTGAAAAQMVNQLAVSLAAGAVIIGDGVLLAGNFSQAGLITGPGTIAVEAGGTLLLAAGSLGGGAHLDIGAGGVLVLGPVSPLYGVFDATPLTVDSSVTLSFAGEPNADGIAGYYADSLDQGGGVLVINGPEAFSGNLTGAAPGDRLIFPGLSDISLFNISAHSFEVAGQDDNGDNQVYTFNSSLASGTQYYSGLDLEGDPEVSLRDTQADVFVNGATISNEEILQSPGLVQSIQGLQVLLNNPTTQALDLTLSVGVGKLQDGTLGPASALTLTASNITALNAELAGLSYTGTGANDVLSIRAGNGVLNGLSTAAPIIATPVGVVSGFSGGVAAGEAASFGVAGLAPVTQDAAPGEIIVSAFSNFDDVLQVDNAQFYANAITVGNGATAIFGAAAVVAADGNVVIGNAAQTGTIAITGPNFLVGSELIQDNFILSDHAAAGGSAAYVSGDLGVSGSVVVGLSAVLDLSGQFGAAATSIGVGGTLSAYGGAVAAFGRVLDGGTLYLVDQVLASASAAEIAGTLGLGGTALLTVQGGITEDVGGFVTIGADAILQGATARQNGGSMIDAGMVRLTSLVAGSAITLSGGVIAAGSISLTAGAVLEGAGSIVSGSLANAGTILANGGGLFLGGNIGNAGVIEIGAGGFLDVAHAVSGHAISFTGSSAELTVNDVGVFAAGAANMVGHDVIDLIGVAPSLVSFAAGSITVTDTAGVLLGGFALGVASGQPAVKIISDNHGGALLTLGGEMPCFARGSRLLTPNGYRPVEALAPGDPLITAAGDRRAIKWMGRRTLDLAGLRPERPVVIAAHAFGPGQPVRPLKLSPLHAVFCGGVLVPVVHLVNGATIRQEAGCAAVTYFHVELDRHDVVLADGLACETYFDNGNRDGLYDEVGTRTPARRPCAPLVTAGAKLAAIRRGLHAIALAAGYSLTYQTRLRGVADECSVVPEIKMRRGRRVARFALPAGSRKMTLLSESATPADTDPDSEDRRELGVCLARARAGADGAAKLGHGWLPRVAADGGIWMGRQSELVFAAPAEALTLTLQAIVRSWREPVDMRARHF